MDPFIGVMFVLWCLKVFAEDSWSTVTGRSNPRLDRRRARQKSRAKNPIWNQLVGYLGDLAEDARNEQARARQEKRERQAEERRRRDLASHPTVDAEVVRADWLRPFTGRSDIPGEATDPAVLNVDQSTAGPPEETKPDPRRHRDMTPDECPYEWCPIHGKEPQGRPQNDPSPSGPGNTNQQGESTMSDVIEVQGLDQAIAYAEQIAAAAEQHGTTGNEGYIGSLEAAKVAGDGLQSAYEMQAAFDAAQAAAEAHLRELEKQKAVQEAYDANPDAGDKEFQQAGR